MALEVPNVVEAQGKFDGFDPVTNPIIRSEGIRQFDPDTTPAAPLGGFTKIAAGDYLIKVLRPVAFLESIIHVNCRPSKNAPAAICAVVLDAETAVAPEEINDIAVNANLDQMFDLTLLRIATGGTANP